MAITIRFYEELNDFLKHMPHKQRIEFELKDRRSVKDLIESQFGVPHVEVDLILVNGNAVGFDYIVKDGDHISVYPMFERFDIREVSALKKAPLRRVRFVLDVHLGKLATYLLMLGFDIDYAVDRDDETLASISKREQRILLTMDRRLLMRKIVDHGLIVRNSDPKEQIIEILNRLDLWDQIKPLTRCLRCSGKLIPLRVDSETFKLKKSKIPKGVLAWCTTYTRCSRCGHIYWEGSHLESMQKTIETILSQRPKAYNENR